MVNGPVQYDGPTLAFWRTLAGQMKAIEVSAGVIFREGKLLLTQRPAGGHLAGLWEFPGGKREPGESFERCLERELLEELGIEVEIGERLESLTHEYPERTVHLEFFRCRWLRHEPKAIGCAAFDWVLRDELLKHPLPEADARLIEMLQRDAHLWRAD